MKISTEEKNDVSEETLTRFRESKERADAEAEQAGIDAGRDWAQKKAEVAELRRLAAFVHTNDGWRFGEEGEFEFFRVTNPHEIPSTRGIAEFWRTVTDGEETPDPLFIEAFVSGAVDFWDVAQEKL